MLTKTSSSVLKMNVGGFPSFDILLYSRLSNKKDNWLNLDVYLFQSVPRRNFNTWRDFNVLLLYDS